MSIKHKIKIVKAENNDEKIIIIKKNNENTEKLI